MNNKDIAKTLNFFATLLELKGENPFKIRAYQKAARTIENIQNNLKNLNIEELIKINGIGKNIAEKIIELNTSGKIKELDALKKEIPNGIIEMLKIPNLGPKRIKQIYEILNITSIGELEYACLENRLKNMPNFGEKLQQKILQNIKILKTYKDRFLFPEAYNIANLLKNFLYTKLPNAKIEIAGSIRRKKETVHDIDILISYITPEDWEKLKNLFSKKLTKSLIIGMGDTKISIYANEKIINQLSKTKEVPYEISKETLIQVDMRFVPDESFPFALQHFTGSKEHNTKLRSIAKKMGYKSNEYGIFKNDKKIEANSEEDIYKILNLQYIPPELREDIKEIEAAAENKIPVLVSRDDIKGFFHCHTNYSDGQNSIKEIIQYALKKKYEYIGISDHSKSAFYAHGLEEERIYQQKEEINSLQKKYPQIKIFWGIESDILKDGSLDYSEDILKLFDFVIGSIHSNFSMKQEDMENRILAALANPYLTILGHPSGRLLLSREPFDIDMIKILEAAKKYNKIIEINANPHRLDIDWRYIPYGKKLGILFSINPDAHRLEGINDIEYGVNIARKGWLEPINILNTYSKTKVEKILKKEEQYE